MTPRRSASKAHMGAEQAVEGLLSRIARSLETPG